MIKERRSYYTYPLCCFSHWSIVRSHICLFIENLNCYTISFTQYRAERWFLLNDVYRITDYSFLFSTKYSLILTRVSSVCLRPMWRPIALCFIKPLVSSDSLRPLNLPKVSSFPTPHPTHVWGGGWGGGECLKPKLDPAGS